jgi:hypothetical protein
LNNLAELSQGLGELDEAESYAWAVGPPEQQSSVHLQAGVSRLTLGRTLREKGDLAGACEQCALSLELYERESAQLPDDVLAELSH